MGTTQFIDLHTLPDLKEINVGKHVKLQTLEIEHSEQILTILAKDPSIRSRVSVASKIFTIDDIAKQIIHYKSSPNLIRYVILENGIVIGLVSFWRDVANYFDAPDNPYCYGFGYFLDPEKRGQGIVSECLIKISNIAQEHLYVDQFIAYCEDDNLKSINILKNLGFQKTGITLTEENTGWIERKYIKSVSHS